MNLIQKMEFWGDSHHPHWLDALRIVLGIVLMVKGVSFVADTESTHRLLESTPFLPVAWGVMCYIFFCHFVGGFFIAIGLLTRYAVAFQLPILIGALFLVHLRSGLTFLNSDLLVAIVVLILLIVFLIVGSGKYSYGERLKNSNAL